MTKGLAYFAGVVATATVLGVSSYNVPNAYAGDHYLDRTRQKLEEIRDKVKEHEKSEKTRERAKDVAGKVLDHVFGIPGADKIIEETDEHSFCPDGKIKRKKDQC